MGWEKVACWNTKAAISLKRVKIDEKLLWELLWSYRNSPSLFRTVPSPTPYGLPFSKIGVCTPPKTPSVISSRIGEATNFKFGQNNNRVHPNKSPWKYFGETEAWVYPGTAQIFWVPPIISGTRKATASGAHVGLLYEEIDTKTSDDP